MKLMNQSKRMQAQSRLSLFGRRLNTKDSRLKEAPKITTQKNALSPQPSQIQSALWRMSRINITLDSPKSRNNLAQTMMPVSQTIDPARNFSLRLPSPLVRTKPLISADFPYFNEPTQKVYLEKSFVEPNSLPAIVSPRKYGRYLVRKFDGEMHETQAEVTRTTLQDSIGKDLYSFGNDEDQSRDSSYVAQSTSISTYDPFGKNGPHSSRRELSTENGSHIRVTSYDLSNRDKYKQNGNFLAPTSFYPQNSEFLSIPKQKGDDDEKFETNSFIEFQNDRLGIKTHTSRAFQAIERRGNSRNTGGVGAAEQRHTTHAMMQGLKNIIRKSVAMTTDKSVSSGVETNLRCESPRVDPMDLETRRQNWISANDETNNYLKRVHRANLKSMTPKQRLKEINKRMKEERKELMSRINGFVSPPVTQAKVQTRFPQPKRRKPSPAEQRQKSIRKFINFLKFRVDV